MLALPDDLLKRVDEKITALSENPRPKGLRKVNGKEGRGYRIRVGKLRVLYDINDRLRVISVYRIDKLESVYKKR